MGEASTVVVALLAGCLRRAIALSKFAFTILFCQFVELYLIDLLGPGRHLGFKLPSLNIELVELVLLDISAVAARAALVIVSILLCIRMAIGTLIDRLLRLGFLLLFSITV